jgi:predicted permease
MKVIKTILSVYSWAAIGVLIAFLGRIAYFYAKTSGQRVGYYWLILPALLLVAGVVCYLRYSGDFTGQPTGDLLLFGGGALLCLFGSRLQELMTGERR